MTEPTQEQRRRSLLARIHIAKKELAMDDDTYRDMLQMVTGKRSSSLLSAFDLARVVKHMLRIGLKPKPSTKHRGRPNVPADHEALVGKIEAILAEAQRPWAYADGMAKRMFEVERVQWCDAEQLRKIVAALMYDKGRRGKR